MKDKKSEALRRKLLDQIREHMEANNITQEEASTRSGLIQSNVSRLLAGKYSPTLDNLLQLCLAVGLRVEVRSLMYKPASDEG
jgi:predicted XRE-type DNA-binding protein